MATPSRIQAPQIDRIQLGELRDGDPDDLERNTDLEGVQYDGIRDGELDLGGGSLISQCSFRDLVVDELGLASSRIRETRFDRVATSVLKMARTNLMDVEFSGGRLGAIEAYDLRCKAVHFNGVKINYLNLRGAELVDVLFTDCIIDDLDLSQTKAMRVRLTGTRIGNLNVRDSKLTNVDLRGARIETVTGPFALAGAVLSSQQVVDLAPAMAREVGIIVAD
ncbi:pentapeptide repeat-containing protein [Nocardioides alcanivorans]|uniref:pentapeptide repeat-containing protein n=1 Tax=Nocardioides alcanivorans TaxID=2897352 RepID=UPI001F418944|nr:pentapeptide repeat-containing protein [Nocardioides alcanivorans]